MITPEMARRSRQLADVRQGFVTATVVRTQHPTSVQPGSAALVLADGTIEGFVGGVCAEHSVRAYSLAALESGEPVLLRILPDPEQDAAEDEGLEGTVVASEEGTVTVRNPCLSGGAIEVFLEPAPPPPRVLVVGDTPVVDALERIGTELGLDMVESTGPQTQSAADDLALVVAAHGRDELGALRRALEARVPYVGLVASERRGAGVLDQLRDDGVPDELVARIDVPAGIPIGSHTAAEIAVSILAKLVSVRRAGSGPAAGEARQAPVGSGSLAVDPICGMTVAAVESTPSVRRDGETVYFCSESCKAAFEARGEHASLAR